MNWFSMNPSKEASFTLPPPPPPLSPSATKFESKISPSILLIIVILAVIFFISGILHLLVRFLLRTTVREPEESVNGTALQGQLQELFHLHDAGVDQSFIDTLPIFLYKAIIGLKDPFDCAVCLCEFEPEDKLRLLPKCSHAFHIECIDTWLLSHSTCPVCRRSLFPDFSPAHSPMVLVLESANGSPTATFPTATFGSNRDENGLNSRLSSADVDVKEEGFRLPEEKIVAVKLGNFRNVDVGREGEGEGSNNGNSNADLGASQRRCFSMGSYEYVMDESCVLRVAINTAKKKKKKKMDNLKMRGYKAMSECSCHPSKERIRDDFKVPELKLNPKNGTSSSSSSSTLKKGESFSVSKIWLQPRKDMAVDGDPGRRAFSFRFPIHRAPAEELKTNHIEFGENWEKNGSEVDLDVEVGSCADSFGSEIGQTPSFARRTLMWIVGKPNRVGSNQLN